MTYKEVAVAVGKPRAYRAVGNALNKNPHLACPNAKRFRVPCHRVVRSDGKAGGYVLGGEKKLKLLELERAKS